MADFECNIEVALAWIIATKNVLTNDLGFSPNQLMLGHNPALPNVFENNFH